MGSRYEGVKDIPSIVTEILRHHGVTPWTVLHRRVLQESRIKEVLNNSPLTSFRLHFVARNRKSHKK